MLYKNIWKDIDTKRPYTFDTALSNSLEEVVEMYNSEKDWGFKYDSTLCLRKDMTYLYIDITDDVEQFEIMKRELGDCELAYEKAAGRADNERKEA